MKSTPRIPGLKPGLCLSLRCGESIVLEAPDLPPTAMTILALDHGKVKLLFSGAGEKGERIHITRKNAQVSE